LKSSRFFQLIFFISIINLSNIFPQDNEPIFESLKKYLKKDYFKVGMLYQFVGEYQPDRAKGHNGFSMANARISIGGNLDNNFSYYIQANFLNSPSLLDAKMIYKFSDYLTVDIGQQKAPLSREYLTSAASIDFVNRSQVVSSIAVKRQLGVLLRGDFKETAFGYSLGVFNGNGIVNGNDDEEFMYVGKLTYKNSFDNDKSFAAGLGGAFNKKNTVTDKKKEYYFDFDYRLTLGEFSLSGEYIYKKTEFNAGANPEDSGYHLTAGYMVSSFTQLLVRYDSFTPANSSSKSDYFILGVNLFPTSATEFQVNYLVNTKTGSVNQNLLLVNCQVAF